METTVISDSTNWASLIGQLGFPIFVCIWFMWRDFKVLSALQDIMSGVREEIGKLNVLIETILKDR